MSLNDVPQAAQTLAQTQNPIRQNFSAINTAFSVNHNEINGVGQGKHKFLQMPENAAPATAVNEAGFYANVGATSAVTELYFRRENNGTSIPATETVEVTASNGWTYLPSGVIMQWGTQIIDNGTLFTFPKAMTKTYSVQLTSREGNPSKVSYRIDTVTAGTSINASAFSVNPPQLFSPTNTFILVLGI